MLFANSWTLVKEEQGVTVYTVAVEGSDFLAYRGETVIEASMASIIAVLYDTPNCVSWLYECTLGVTLEEISFEENYIFERYDLTFPVSDRGILLHSRLLWEDNHAILYIEDANDYCEGRSTSRCERIRSLDLIAITHSKGSYTLKTLDENRTSVVWQVHTEPGGSIPTWVVNMMVVDMPYHSLLNLRSLVQQDQYKNMSREKLQRLWQDQYDKHH